MKLSAIQRFTMLDYPDQVACIAFTPGCNMRCGFCHNPEFVLPEKIRELQGNFIAEETFFNFLDRRRGRLEGVVVSGGEPTIWLDLPEFLRTIKAKGFLTKLDTNGHHPAMIEQLLAEKLVDYVAMDVKTSLGEYPKLVGGGVQVENIARSIALLKASCVPYEFRTTFIREVHTPDTLPALEDLVRGAKRYAIQSFRPGQTLNPLFGTYTAFSQDEMSLLTERFQHVAEEVILRG